MTELLIIIAKHQCFSAYMDYQKSFYDGRKPLAFSEIDPTAIRYVVSNGKCTKVSG